MCPVREFINVFDGSPHINNDKTFLAAVIKVMKTELPPEEEENEANSFWMEWTYRNHYHIEDQADTFETVYVNIQELLSIYGYYDNSDGDYNYAANYNRFLQQLNGISFSLPGLRNAVPTHPPIKSVPKYIRDILVDHMVAKKEECPITTELLTAENIAITTCFHFFDKTGITRWLAQDATCPQCRESAGLIP